VASQVVRAAGSLIAEDWAEGFLQRSCCALTPEIGCSSPSTMASYCPILALCGDDLLGLPPEDEERIMKDAVEFVPRASPRSPPIGSEKDRSNLRTN
jgi:hypothetical protein